jgi:hypothetical protein
MYQGERVLEFGFGGWVKLYKPSLPSGISRQRNYLVEGFPRCGWVETSCEHTWYIFLQKKKNPWIIINLSTKSRLKIDGVLVDMIFQKSESFVVNKLLAVNHLPLSLPHLTHLLSLQPPQHTLSQNLLIPNSPQKDPASSSDISRLNVRINLQIHPCECIQRLNWGCRLLTLKGGVLYPPSPSKSKIWNYNISDEGAHIKHLILSSFADAAWTLIESLKSI